MQFPKTRHQFRHITLVNMRPAVGSGARFLDGAIHFLVRAVYTDTNTKTIRMSMSVSTSAVGAVDAVNTVHAIHVLASRAVFLAPRLARMYQWADNLDNRSEIHIAKGLGSSRPK